MLTLFSLALVCYRLTRLLVYDDGPFDVFAKLRMRAGVYDYAANGKPATQLGRLLACPHCTGIYVALVMVGVAQWMPDWSMLALAIAGAQSWLQSKADR